MNDIYREKLNYDMTNGFVRGYTASKQYILEALSTLMNDDVRKEVMKKISLEDKERMSYLNSILVEKKNMGTGKNLYHLFEENAKKQHSKGVLIIVNTDEKNDMDLIHWYQTLGFQLIYSEDKESYPFMFKSLLD